MTESMCPICGGVLGASMISAPDRLHGTSRNHQVATCRRCGAGATLPPMADEDLAACYPAEYGPYDERMTRLERLISRTIRGLQGWQAMRHAPLAALRGVPAGRGLDVGCGRGDLAATVAGIGWTMSGIEPSPSACQIAASRGIDARCGTLSTVDLEAGSFEAAIFHHSLEHINDPVGALTTVARALAAKGLVLVTVPNFGSWQARHASGSWYHLDLPRHRVHFTATALEHALRAAGLKVVSLSTSSSAVGLPASLQYRIFGRCLFPSGLGLRIASGMCAVTLPASCLLARLTGGGDVLHAVAQRP